MAFWPFVCAVLSCSPAFIVDPYPLWLAVPAVGRRPMGRAVVLRIEPGDASLAPFGASILDACAVPAPGHEAGRHRGHFRKRKLTSVLGAFEGVGRNPLRARGALHRIPIA